MEDALTNKVAASGLITIDLDNYSPQEPVASFDLKDFLYMGLVLKEKDYREALKTVDWSAYRDKTVAVFCSADAIVPTWAFMLAAVHLQPLTARIGFGTPAELETQILLERIRAIDPGPFRDKKVVVKGCGDKELPASAFLEITRLLQPVVKSLMYGEACSTVPLFKSR